MRVFQINTVTQGSTGKIARDISDGIKRHGGESILAYGRGTAPDDGGDYFKFTSDLSIYAHVLKSRITDRAGFYSASDTYKLIKRITQYSPDIIHIHNIHGYYVNIKILFEFFKEYNRPVVWTLHDCWSFTGHCPHFDLIGCDKWQSGCFDCINKKEYPKSVLLDNSKKNYKQKKELFSGNEFLTLVAVSHWLDGLVRKSFFKDTKSRVIHNGINTDVFKYKKSDIGDRFGGKKIVLGVAYIWDRKKGYNDFLRLAEMLPSEYRVVLVGLSKDQIKKLPSNIFGITRTDSIEELVELYSASEVFVNMTYEDNLPTVNIEATACKTPVISYDTGGCSECVFDGMVVPRGDVLAVYDAIVNNKYKMPSINPELLDRKKMSEEYIKLYEEIMKKTPYEVF